MIRKAKLILLSLLLLLCLSLTGCGDSNTEYDTLHDATNEAARDMLDAQDKVKDLSEKKIINENLNWIAWAIPGYISQNTLDKASKKVESTTEIYNGAKGLEDKAKKDIVQRVSDEAGSVFNDWKVTVVISVTAIMLILVLILALRRPKVINNVSTPAHAQVPIKTPEKLPEPVEQPRLEMAERSERLKADYPSLLKKDCEILGKNYDEVLSDFDGNAEKAYETIHVKALKVTYKE